MRTNTSKWTNISQNCVSCHNTHDIPHMIYYCTVCKSVWDNNWYYINYTDNTETHPTYI